MTNANFSLRCFNELEIILCNSFFCNGAYFRLIASLHCRHGFIIFVQKYPVKHWQANCFHPFISYHFFCCNTAGQTSLQENFAPAQYLFYQLKKVLCKRLIAAVGVVPSVV